MKTKKKLKKETEDFTLAAPDPSISTQAYQSRILSNGADPNSRLCRERGRERQRERETERQRQRQREREETVDHVLSACPTIVNTEYLQRHDQVISFTHWILCKNFNHPHTEKWYEHTPQPVTERTKVTNLWHFPINTDRKIEVN